LNCYERKILFRLEKKSRINRILKQANGTNVENNLLGLVKDLLLRFSIIDFDEVPTVRGYIQG